MNAPIIRPNPSKHPHTLEFDHGYTAPPHCKARNKQTIDEIMKSAPRKSSLSSLSFRDKSGDFGAGALKVKRITAIANAPKAKDNQSVYVLFNLISHEY